VSGVSPAWPGRSRRNPVSSSRRIARSMRICRTTRSCTASRQGLWGRSSRKGQSDTVSGQRGTPRRGRASHTTVRYSTASSRNRDAGWPALNGAESSSRPSFECTRSTGSNGRPQSTAPSPQNRVDLRNHLADWPGPMAAENRLERAQQRRPLCHPRGAKRHPAVSPTANHGSQSREIRSARLA
jgi:hypothetical protein